jgi:hypothetical protein
LSRTGAKRSTGFRFCGLSGCRTGEELKPKPLRVHQGEQKGRLSPSRPSALRNRRNSARRQGSADAAHKAARPCLLRAVLHQASSRDGRLRGERGRDTGLENKVYTKHLTPNSLRSRSLSVSAAEGSSGSREERNRMPHAIPVAPALPLVRCSLSAERISRFECPRMRNTPILPAPKTTRLSQV